MIEAERGDGAPKKLRQRVFGSIRSSDEAQTPVFDYWSGAKARHADKQHDTTGPPSRPLIIESLRNNKPTMAGKLLPLECVAPPLQSFADRRVECKLTSPSGVLNGNGNYSGQGEWESGDKIGPPPHPGLLNCVRYRDGKKKREKHEVGWAFASLWTTGDEGQHIRDD